MSLLLLTLPAQNLEAILRNAAQKRGAKGEGG